MKLWGLIVATILRGTAEAFVCPSSRRYAWSRTKMYAKESKGTVDFPEFDLKSFEIPKVSLDPMKLPEMPEFSSFHMPKVSLESMKLPELFDILEMPNMDIPKIPKIDLPQLPSIGVPGLPEIDLVKFPNIDSQSIGVPSDGIVLPAIAVGLVGLIAALIASGNRNTESVSSSARKSMRKPRKGLSNFAVPYDAAARLAYDAWCKANDEAFNEAGYEHFREVFSAKAVADATAKKLGRDLAVFKNKAPTAPPRNISLRKPATSTINGDRNLYFAKSKS